MKWLVRWLLLAVALMAISYGVEGISINSYTQALVAAAALGLLNLLVRPLLVLLTLPVTVLTLGLFLLVINALMFWWAANLLDGFAVNGFWTVMLGSVLYSLCGLVIDTAVQHLFRRE